MALDRKWSSIIKEFQRVRSLVETIGKLRQAMGERTDKHINPT